MVQKRAVIKEQRQHHRMQAQSVTPYACVPAGLPATWKQALPSKPSPKASPQTSWALRALKQSSSKQTQMLESLLKQHLQKQLLLAGNPVVVPVLGHQCVFRLDNHCLCVC